MQFNRPCTEQAIGVTKSTWAKPCAVLGTTKPTIRNTCWSDYLMHLSSKTGWMSCRFLLSRYARLTDCMFWHMMMPHDEIRNLKSQFHMMHSANDPSTVLFQNRYFGTNFVYWFTLRCTPFWVAGAILIVVARTSIFKVACWPPVILNRNALQISLSISHDFLYVDRMLLSIRPLWSKWGFRFFVSNMLSLMTQRHSVIVHMNCVFLTQYFQDGSRPFLKPVLFVTCKLSMGQGLAFDLDITSYCENHCAQCLFLCNE